jgi:hypothetical protein
MSAPGTSLIDEAILAELLAEADTPEGVAMLQQMFRNLHTATETEIVELEQQVGDDPARRRRLHRLKGMLANYGFAACARLLAEWEQEEGAAARRTTRCAEVQALFQRSREELKSRYPWLA